MINTLNDHKIKVIGFDADDTLWENEDLFFNSLKEIKNILKQDSNNFDKEFLKTEKLNLDIYGYGIKGFILSLIETSAKISVVLNAFIRLFNQILVVFGITF